MFTALYRILIQKKVIRYSTYEQQRHGSIGTIRMNSNGAVLEQYVWTATARQYWNMSLGFRTSNIVPERLAEKVWFYKSQSLLLNIFTSVSVGSSPLSFLFPSATVRIPVYTLHQGVAQNFPRPPGSRTYPMCYDPLPRLARRSFAPLPLQK